MFIFKSGLVILSVTYIISLCYQVTQDKYYFMNSLAFLYLASAAIAVKILYDRCQHIHILGSLTPNPHVTLFTNKIASYSAGFLFLGFLVYFFLFIFKVNSQCITALNIFVCGFGTLYIWMQLPIFRRCCKHHDHGDTAVYCKYTKWIITMCILTTYVATLFYDKHLTLLRQCLANLSFPILLVLAVFGTISTYLPIGGSSGMNFCLIVTTLCSYSLAAIFCVFLISFEKDYQYFTEGIRSDYLLDDGCSLNDDTLSDVDSIFGTQDASHPIVIKGHVTSTKVS